MIIFRKFKLSQHVELRSFCFWHILLLIRSFSCVLANQFLSLERLKFYKVCTRIACSVYQPSGCFK